MTPLASLSHIIKKTGLTIGFANGCFDMLHDGHLHLLKTSLRYCDVLFVGVNDDASVKQMKGDGRPLKPLRDRMKDLENTGLCSGIFGFNSEDDLLELISEIKPDYLIKGEDYRGKKITGEENIRQHGGLMLFIPLLPGVSTTRLLQ